MISYEGKQAVMQLILLAEERVLAKQDVLVEEIEQLLKLPTRLPKSETAEADAAEFFALLDDFEPEEGEGAALQRGSWLPPEIDQIPDGELRGLLGIYHQTLTQLQVMQASRDFVVILAECN